MSMTVDVRVNGEQITRLEITNLTRQMSDVNTYRWLYTRHDLGVVNGLLSVQEGTVEHIYEDGAMALIAKIAQAASETEVAQT
jgi:hypothetical protein